MSAAGRELPEIHEALSWAEEVGEDPYGIYAEMRLGAAKQVFRWIAPGKFLMGSAEGESGGHAEDKPQHSVALTRGFWLADTPCTQAVWEVVMGKGQNPSFFCTPDRPVECVSWSDVSHFLDRLNDQFPGSSKFARPSEAQWEYACRAGSTEATYAGDIQAEAPANSRGLDEIAWYAGNSGVEMDLRTGMDIRQIEWFESRVHEFDRAGTRRVKEKSPNRWGLYDMLGNVSEWCEDNWAANYQHARGEDARERTFQDPLVANHGSERVFRGGSWYHEYQYLRSAYRDKSDSEERHCDLGFRLARGQMGEGL